MRLFSGLSYELKDNIMAYIEEHGLKTNDQLPSERILSEYFHVNRKTLRESLRSLCNEGKLYSIQGKGTFIAEPKFEILIQDGRAFRYNAAASTYNCSIKNIYIKMMLPKDFICLAFHIDEKTPVETSLNMIYINNEPIAYETIYTKLGYKDDFDDKVLIQKRKNFSLSKATEDEALLLGIPLHALVMVERIYAYKDNEVLQCYISIVDASKVKFKIIETRNNQIK